MTMGKWIIILCAILSLTLLTTSCEKKPTVLVNPQEYSDYDIKNNVVTVGNWSYIPLNINGKPADHVIKILGALEAFKKEYPERKITDWKIEKQQYAYFTSSYIFGIWIDHQPNTVK